MAAIDDALFKYIGNDSGTSVYWDSGPSMAHGLLVGSSPHSPPLWVNDGGKNVIHFDAVAGYNGFAENAPRIQVSHDWGNFGGDDFSIAMWIRVKTDLAGTHTLLCNEYAAGSSRVYRGSRFRMRAVDSNSNCAMRRCPIRYSAPTKFHSMSGAHSFLRTTFPQRRLTCFSMRLKRITTQGRDRPTLLAILLMVTSRTVQQRAGSNHMHG